MSAHAHVVSTHARCARPTGGLRGKLVFGLFGLLAFAVFSVALLPAGLLARAVEDAQGVALRDVDGTVWRGAAGLTVQGEDLGRAQWRLDPSALLAGALGITWRLRHENFRFAGAARRGSRAFSASASGVLNAAALGRVLGKYHIRLGGDFTFDRLALRVVPQGGEAPDHWHAEGDLRWSGGRTTYRLSGQSYDVEFPPLDAELRTTADSVRLQAFLQPDGAGRGQSRRKPLLEARLDGDGWLHVSVTRRFTRLAGKPWPGVGEDDVVVTVSEQLLGAGKMTPLP